MPATNNISRPYMAANPTSTKQRYSPATTAHVGNDTKEENESRPFHTDQYRQYHQQINEHQDRQYKAYNHPYFAPYTNHYNQPYFGEQQPVPGPYQNPDHDYHQRQQHAYHLQPQTLRYPPKESHTPFQYPPKGNMIPYQTTGEPHGRNEWHHEANRPGNQNPNPTVYERNTQQSTRVQMPDNNHLHVSDSQTAYTPSHPDPTYVANDRFVDKLTEKNIPEEHHEYYINHYSSWDFKDLAPSGLPRGVEALIWTWSSAKPIWLPSEDYPHLDNLLQKMKPFIEFSRELESWKRKQRKIIYFSFK